MLNELKSQYQASLQTMRVIIDKCPLELWTNESFANKTWHICYHALFYTNLYLSQDENNVETWNKSKLHYQFMGKVEWTTDFDPQLALPYSQDEMVEFCLFVESRLDTIFKTNDFDRESGFHWLPFNRFELYLYTLRHLQHHIGQLIERLAVSYNISTPWIGIPKK